MAWPCRVLVLQTRPPGSLLKDEISRLVTVAIRCELTNVNPDSPTCPIWPKFVWLRRVLSVSALFLLMGFLFSAMFPCLCATVEEVSRNVDASNLSSIGQGWQAAESAGKVISPEALTDIYTFAAQLARAGEITDARLWFSRIDVARGNIASDITRVLNPADLRQLNPTFKSTPLAYTVALLPALKQLPPATPIMWTRGLQPDGTWRADSPYGDWGGHILFADGHIKTFHRLKPMLVKWSTAEPTSNVREALPPGTRIVDNTPTAGDLWRGRVAWWRALLLPLSVKLLALGLVFGCGCLFERWNGVWWNQLAAVLGGVIFAIWFWYSLMY